MSTNVRRGSALLTVVALMMVLALAGAALLVVSRQSSAAAKHAETSVGLANCAMAVRQYVASKISGGSAMDSLSFAIPTTKAPITLQGGHYDAINITTFNLPPGPAFGTSMVSSTAVENLANALPMNLAVKAQTTSGTAVCTDVNGRTYEVEFSYVSN